MPQRRSHFPISTPNTAAAPSSSPSSFTKKRARSPPPPPSSSHKSTPTRQSKRLKVSPDTTTKTTAPKKSPYFEHPSSSSEGEEEESAAEKEESGYEDEDASAVPSQPSSDLEEDEDESSEGYNSDADPPPTRKKKRGRQPKAASKPMARRTKENGDNDNDNDEDEGGKKATSSELWRPGVKSHLPPGSAIFIKLPQARLPGKTPYKPSTIHPNTLLFLRDLRAHNDRDWLKTNDKDYRASLADWASFVDCLTAGIINDDDDSGGSVDDTIPDLPAKDLIFRIYRDVRFSPDPTPYKTHFSAAWSRTGRKGPYAGYYVQIQPGGTSFVGAGVWHPEAGPLGLLRTAVDRRVGRLKDVLKGEGVRREFLGGVKGDDEAGCVRMFVKMNQEGALKTKPKVR